MEKLQIWIDLQDTRYAKRLTEFLMARYGDKLQVDDAAGKQGDGGVLLTDKEENRDLYGQVIWVSKEQGLNPYQSGHEIAREILEKQTVSFVKEEPVSFGEKKGDWISIYSPVGGIGKSTLAMGLADVLAQKKKVLYVSLEGPSAWILYYHYPLSYNLSDYFYSFLIGNANQKRQYLLEMVQQQSNGVYFMPPCLYPDDLLELTESELVGWMDLLRNEFDYVVADFSSQLIQPLRTILQRSQKACFIVDQRAEGQAKWQDYQLLNRYLQNQLVFCRHGDRTVQDEIILPEDPQLFEFHEGKRRFQKKGVYYRNLEKVVQEWI